MASCRLTGHYQSRRIEKADSGLRIRQLQLAISHGLSFHNLLNVSRNSYEELQNEGGSHAILALAVILRESLGRIGKAEVSAASTMTMDFFLKAFRYRLHDPEEADSVEEIFGQAFLSFGLKLSLDDFKPLFYRLFNLALDVEDGVAISTVFHLTAMVAHKLKSLFSFAYEMVVLKATSILKQIAKGQEKEAIGYVLDALAAIFTYNKVDSMLVKNYEDHVNAMLELLENEDVDDKLLGKLTTCVGQLAATTDDETQWKYLNYQVLMGIRSRNSEVNKIVELSMKVCFHACFFFNISRCASPSWRWLTFLWRNLAKVTWLHYPIR